MGNGKGASRVGALTPRRSFSAAQRDFLCASSAQAKLREKRDAARTAAEKTDRAARTAVRDQLAEAAGRAKDAMEKAVQDAQSCRTT